MSFRVGGRRRVMLDTGRESMTIQSSRDECDINILMAKYEKTGMLTHLAKNPPRYEDVSFAVPFQEALNIVMVAEAEFMNLSSSIRARFENDPGKYFDFVSDEANAEEMVRIGIAVKREPVAPSEVVVTNFPESSPPGK